MISTSNDTVLRKDMPFGGTKNENEIVHFDHSFVKKNRNFWTIFGETLKISARKGLNTEDLTRKQ